MIHLITGFANTEHIKSADDGSYHAATIGQGQYVLNIGNKMSGSIVDNNTVRVSDGDILMKGRHIRIEPSTYEDAAVDNGAAGYSRKDLVVMTYEKNSITGIETAYVETIKGTASTTTPVDPAYTSGDIINGAVKNQMPLYRCNINGITLESIDCLFSEIGNVADHITSTSNPHSVTKEQISLGNVPNVSTNNQTPTYTEATSIGALVSGEKISVAFGKIAKAVSSLITHLSDAVRHITANERTAWNAKQDAITLTASRAVVTNSSGKVASASVTSTELGYLDGVTSAIQTQINSKQATITGAATTIDTENLTASRAVVSDANGKVSVSSVTSTELGYLGSVTSDVQTQINGKAPKAHASTATTYGIGTGSNYGHVKLSDAINSTSAASAGIAASPKAAKTAYDKAVSAYNGNIIIEEGTFVTSSLSGNADHVIDMLDPLPTKTTEVALVVKGIIPGSTWNTTANVMDSTIKTIGTVCQYSVTLHTVGSTAQTYSIKYILIKTRG